MNKLTSRCKQTSVSLRCTAAVERQSRYVGERPKSFRLVISNLLATTGVGQRARVNFVY